MYTHADYTVGWICAVDIERHAARAVLDEIHSNLKKVPGDPSSYILGSIGPHNVVIAALPSSVYGIGSAATAATHVWRSFPNLRFSLLVGIGGAIPYLTADPRTTRDVRLGDVVVSVPQGTSNGVIQYDIGKLQDGERWPECGALAKPPRELLHAVSALKSAYQFGSKSLADQHKAVIDKHPLLWPEYAHQGAHNDRFFKSSYKHQPGGSCEDCDQAQEEARPVRVTSDPVVHYGTIASGNSVVKDAVTRDYLRDSKAALCIEMEAAGLMDDFKCLVIRGMCDYADSHKNDVWQPYAALIAAAYAKDLVLEISPEGSQEAPVQTACSIYQVPTNHVPRFFGRETLLQNIEDELLHTSKITGRAKIAILRAMGGQGKTQIALQMCLRLKKQMRGVFWVDASSQETTESGFERIATALDSSYSGESTDKSALVRMVLRTLESWGDRHLLVLDNYDTPSSFSIQEFIPSSEYTAVLITSRHTAAAYLGISFEIPPMTSDGGEALLLDQYHGGLADNANDEVNKIIRRLGGLALAIAQASAYISYRRIDLAQFLIEYDEKKETILKHVRVDFWEYHKDLHQDSQAYLSAYTTWELSLKRIEAEERSANQQYIIDFLRVSAFLDPFHIGEDLFREYVKHSGANLFPWLALFTSSEDGRKSSSTAVWDPVKFWDVLTILQTASIIEVIGRDTDAAYFSIHPVISDWLLLRDNKQRRQLTLEDAFTLVSTLDAEEFRFTVDVRRRNQRLSHVDSILSKCSQLCIPHVIGDTQYLKENVAFAKIMMYSDRLKDAEALLSDLLANARARKNSLALERIIFHLAAVITWQGRKEESLKLLLELLDMQKDSSRNIETRMMLMDVTLGLQDFKKAETIGLPLLDDFKRFYPENSANIVFIYKSLGQLYQRLNQDHKSESYNLLALEKSRTIHGYMSTRTSSILYELAANYNAQKRFAEAEASLLESVSISKRLQGDHHWNTFTSVTALSFTYMNLGKLEEAEALLLGMETTNKNVTDPRCNEYSMFFHEKARLRMFQGRFAEAETLAHKVMKLRQEKFSKYDPETLRSMHILGWAIWKNGRHDEGSNILKEAESLSRATYGADHPLTKECQRLAESYPASTTSIQPSQPSNPTPAIALSDARTSESPTLELTTAGSMSPPTTRKSRRMTTQLMDFLKGRHHT